MRSQRSTSSTPHASPHSLGALLAATGAFASVMMVVASAAWAGFTITPRQESNFQLMAHALEQSTSPNAAEVHRLYVLAHQAMRTNNVSEYRETMGQLSFAVDAMTPGERDRLTSLASSLPREAVNPVGPGIQCTINCSGGSCSGTASCRCNIFGNPICTDTIGPGLPRWAPIGMAGILFATAGWWRRRRAIASA